MTFSTPTFATKGDAAMYQIRLDEWREQKAAFAERKRQERERAALEEAGRKLMAAPTQTAPCYTTEQLEHSLAEIVAMVRREFEQRLGEQQVQLAELRVKVAEQAMRILELEQRLVEPRRASVPSLHVLPSAG